MRAGHPVTEAEDRASEQSRRGAWTFWAKAVVTISILSYLLWRIDLAQFVHALRESLGLWLVLAFAVNSLGLFVSTYKWDRLLRGLGIFAGWWHLLELYTIGTFISSFLPGVGGGDVVRWQMTTQRTGKRLKVAVTILAERATGVIALVVFCVPAAVLAVPEFAVAPVLLPSAAVGLGLLGGLALVWNRRLAVRLTYATRRHPLGRLIRPLYKVQKTLGSFSGRTLSAALGYSILFYLSVGLTFYLICRAFDVDVSFIEAVAVQVLICLLLMLPITIGGLGLAQAGDVFLLGILGVSPAQALALSMVRLATYYAYAFLGGALFVRWRGQPGSQQAWRSRRPGVEPGERLGSASRGD